MKTTAILSTATLATAQWGFGGIRPGFGGYGGGFGRFNGGFNGGFAGVQNGLEFGGEWAEGEGLLLGEGEAVEIQEWGNGAFNGGFNGGFSGFDGGYNSGGFGSFNGGLGMEIIQGDAIEGTDFNVDNSQMWTGLGAFGDQWGAAGNFENPAGATGERANGKQYYGEDYIDGRTSSYGGFVSRDSFTRQVNIPRFAPYGGPSTGLNSFRGRGFFGRRGFGQNQAWRQNF
jgi:hypothetical protein